MSEYSSLKATINANIKANNNQEITGSVMNSVLNAMVNSLGAGYQFMGMATPTNPGTAQTPDYKCFYLATTPGTYTNLGELVVADGEVAILKYDSSWTKEVTGIATMGKIESSVLLAGTRFQPTEIVGYIADNGIITPLSQFHSLITSKIPVKVGDAFTFRGRGNVTAPNAFLYNGDSLVSTQIVTGESLNVTIPKGITHIVFASFTNSHDVIPFNLVQTNPVSLQGQIDNTQVIIENEYQKERPVSNYTKLTPIIDMGAGLYSWYDMKVVYTDNPAYKYSKYDVSNISRIKAKGRSYAQDFSLISFVDANEQKISHLYDNVNEVEMDVPANAKFAYVNGGSALEYNIEGYSVTQSYESIIPELDDLENRVSAIENLLIVCTGDSVTEGFDMDGGGYSEYGKAPYPAQLYTMLVDSGYDRYKVVNQGQGGETTPTMVARTGAMACIILNDINLPKDTSWVDLGNSSSIANCNLKIPVKMLDNSTDYPVYFTQAKEVTTPVFIDGNYYNLRTYSLNGQFYMQIQKTDVSNTATKIPAGSLLFTNCSKNPLLNVILGGHNDRSELNFEKWSTMMDACLATSANKGIVLGSHINIWHTWNDLTGTTDAEKHADFKTKSTQRFGIHFIDLYDDFFAHALDYCLAAGYFSDKTQEELHAMEAKLEQHIVPAEFSYDGQHEGNVHLNREGYYVIAKLVFDRLKAIHYI